MELTQQCISGRAGKLNALACSKIESSSSHWTKAASREPLETTLYNRARREHPEDFAKLYATEQVKALETPCSQPNIVKAGGCFNLFLAHRASGCFRLGDGDALVPAENGKNEW